jgi:hypothetical protein
MTEARIEGQIGAPAARAQGGADAPQNGTGESRRGRVRRLLIKPLIRDGFRARAREEVDRHAAFLDRLADTLGYMSDDGLRVLRLHLAARGEGSKRDFWPCFASILGAAEAFEPRPFEELPELLRWFASKAGPDALEAGRHVAEYEFWTRHKRPPVKPEEWTQLRQKAEAMQARAARYREIIAERGATHWPQDQDWLDWYDRREAYVRGLIEGRGSA